MTEIVKVQIPLASNDPHPLPLVYAKGKKNMVQQPLDQATLRAMGSDAKAFFRADYYAATQRWAIGKRVKDQDW